MKSNAFIEIHFAIWGVLAVPLGFAGTFFLVPGLIFEWGIPLLAIAGLLIGYVANLTQMKRAAWLFGLIFHAFLLLAGAYYLPRWPVLLSVPLALANVYSLVVLAVYRNLWTQPSLLGTLEVDSGSR
jgi:hypothetical protein